jgi:hypothetical protein
MKRLNLGLVKMVSLVSLVSACGASTPPPKPPEEAIDTQSSPAGKSTNPNTATNDTATSTTDTSSGTASTAGASSAADPSAGLGSPATAGTATPPAGKGKPAGKGGKEAAAPTAPAGKTGPIISAAECATLTDKYVELVISGEGAPLRGVSGKELVQARELVKASAASDPNFINMQKACVKEIHRSQFTCGMNARSAAEWQDCIR